jgi:phage terminase large subunit-like protein
MPPRHRTSLNVVDAYASDVVEGRVPAGTYHRKACERHLRDRAREGTKSFPYRFDIEKAERYFRFASKLKHYKGEWAGQFIVLEPWQQFRRGSFFGWVHIDTGLRRFRTSYDEVPRKNGKTLDQAIAALYITFYDGEPGAEGYCLATTRFQAGLVFGDAKKLVRSSGLKVRLKVLTKNIHRVDTDSKLEPLGAHPVDGLNPHFIGIDELHKWKTRERLDVMETATGSRRQPVIAQITTAGDDLVSVCGDQHDYACKILDQVLVDETFFAFIAHADIGIAGVPDDDWTLPSTAIKANPNYGVSIKPADLEALREKAIHMPSAAAAYQQDRLNVWVNTDAPWLSMEGWKRGQSAWSAEELRGETCFGAIDLASKIDLAAFALCFPPTATRTRWRYLVRCFTPLDTLVARARRDRAPYLQWAEIQIPGSPVPAAEMKIPGTPWPYLTTNPGNRIDQDVIRQAVLDARDVFALQIQQIGVDPWNAANIEDDLADDGFEVVEVPQTIKHMSLPTKDFGAEVLDGLVDTGGNPLMAWKASNVVVEEDGPENVKPVKKKSRGRIDGIVASIMSRKLAGMDVPASDGPLVVAA